MDAARESKMESDGRAVAIYHVIDKDQRFEESAQALFKLVEQAAKTWPGKKRKLFLDIEGHRSSQGGFDAEMLELQEQFLLGFLGRFLTTIHCPLYRVSDKATQDDDVPSTLIVQEARRE